ncbi:MAG: 2,5-diamino-6-(ribosylamino)-4(3H)-pyrimidinone 5'-phosphate reductase [Methanomassiliicoccales archaeon]|nr:MAG: 2,5-diamino-6-(ribosylamino)-4(3H)-pyrimidinone 5'-phosphate reductase [Methanomassiliicoccales archaeon]
MLPKVIINCAMSADGKIALPTRRQTRISNEKDMIRVHELRNQCDAVLVGIGTVLSDNPKLTVKESYVPNPQQPIRIVLDSKGRIPKDAKVLSPDAPTIVAVSEECEHKIEGAEIIVCGKRQVDIPLLLSILGEKGIGSILVEGGEKVIWSFLRQGLAHEFHVFIGSMVIGGENSPTPAGGEGVIREEDIIPLILNNVERVGDGVLLHYGVEK